jgi:signal transduction histidine kinase
MLLQLPGVDRAGVWIAEADALPGLESLEGVLWDRDPAEAPRDWGKLSLTALPEELVLRMQPIEMALGARRQSAVFGLLMGLDRVLWQPIASNGQIYGALLLGSRNSTAPLPTVEAEQLAAELALALERDAEKQRQHGVSAELALARSVLQQLETSGRTERMLKKLTETRAQEILFCAIGHWDLSQGEPQPVFRWKNGKEAWLASLEAPHIRELCIASWKTGQAAGTEPPNLPNAPALTRLIAIPLRSEGEPVGVLVAGLSRFGASLASMEHLELRAQLAAAAIARYLRKQEQESAWRRLQTWTETAAAPVVVLDRENRVSLTSRSAEKLLQRSFGETDSSDGFIGRAFSELVAESDRARLASWLQARKGIKSGNTDPFIEVHLATESGSDCIRATVAEKAAGAIALLLEEKNKATSETLLAHLELRDVLEWLDEGVLVFDAANRVRAMNTRFTQIANLTPEQATSANSLHELADQLAAQSADPERFVQRWEELAESSDDAIREEVQLLRPAPRLVERSTRPLLDPDGRRLGRVEIYRELTAERGFQAKILQTEKLAALGQMMTGVVHELSNPLTTILGYAQRLLLSKSSGHSEDAHQILQEAERASRILREMLVNARETTIEKRDLDLNELVRRSVDLQRFAPAADRIKIELDLDPVLARVHGDAGRLQQVVMNLLGNARQAIEQEERAGTVKIRTSQSNQRVVLEVQDDGPGIPERIQARIFDPFFTTKPAGVGTGLGLTIVLGIIREHGGNVLVRNVPNGGAHFRIELPTASSAMELRIPRRSPPAPSRDRNKSVPSKSETSPPCARESGVRRKRILVVEDEPVVARLIADVLQDEGLDVQVLLDGRAALERVAHEFFDLIICDMKMPGLDGQHFYKSLLRADCPVEGRILFVTGDVIGHKTRAFLEQYQLPHLPKPFRVEELTSKVFEFFEGKPETRVAARQGKP